MSLLSIFVLLCCTVVCDSSQTFSGDSCKKFQLNKEHLNKRFRGPGLYEVIAPGHHDCVRNCFYFSPCKSTDYNRKDRMCKLNEVDRSQIMASDFEQQNGAIFSDITAWPPCCINTKRKVGVMFGARKVFLANKLDLNMFTAVDLPLFKRVNTLQDGKNAMAGKCGSRPCSKRQRCIPDKDSYHCEDISCGGVPSIQNGKVVISKPGKYLYGHTATVQCDMGFSPNQSTVQCSILEKWEKAVCEAVVTNVALNKPTSMSSLWEISSGGENGVDDNINQFMKGSSCFSTTWDINPWWRVDLEAIYGVLNVTLFNRIDSWASSRASNLSLSVGISDQNMAEVGFVPGQIDDIHTFQFPTGEKARYVQVQLIGEQKLLHLCEVQVFGTPVQ